MNITDTNYFGNYANEEDSPIYQEEKLIEELENEYYLSLDI